MSLCKQEKNKKKKTKDIIPAIMNPRGHWKMQAIKQKQNWKLDTYQKGQVHVVSECTLQGPHLFGGQRIGSCVFKE